MCIRLILSFILTFQSTIRYNYELNNHKLSGCYISLTIRYKYLTHSLVKKHYQYVKYIPLGVFQTYNLSNIYVDRRIYLRILGWTTIYVFSSTDKNKTSVLSRLILWASPKILKNETVVLLRLILWASPKLIINNFKK